MVQSTAQGPEGPTCLVGGREDPAIQRLLTVLAETIDEKSTSDMRQVGLGDPSNCSENVAEGCGHWLQAAPLRYRIMYCR